MGVWLVISNIVIWIKKKKKKRIKLHAQNASWISLVTHFHSKINKNHHLCNKLIQKYMLVSFITVIFFLHVLRWYLNVKGLTQLESNLQCQHVPRGLLQYTISLPPKLISRSNVTSTLLISHLFGHFEILHRARQWHCRALCKISKWFNNWNAYYGRIGFHEIWV